MLINEILNISETVKKANGSQVQNIARHINIETLKYCFNQISGNKASGIDKVSKYDYELNLDENLNDLVSRMKREAYSPKPARRTYIPKAGTNSMRPLGISSFEDKIVESNVALILNEIYDHKFYEFSYGFRPNKNCHQAVKEILYNVQRHKVRYVVEADIKGFFDNINHDWMIKFLEHDISDRKFIDIIKKFLKAGIMENGKFIESDKGSPQGNGASPILANIYLHYVLDMWFNEYFKKSCKGEAYLIRYADDYVACFEYQEEAERYLREMKVRFMKFNLELALEKTKILEFGRFS